LGAGDFSINPYSPHTYSRFGPRKSSDFFEKNHHAPLTADPQCVTVYIMRDKAFVFDLDGTLFETSAKVLQSDPMVGPDYVEFGDAYKLLNESKPLPLIKLAQEVQKEGYRVFILTARRNIIAPAIKRLLARYGITAEYVFCVGDRGFDVAQYKAEILRELGKEFQTFFYDNEKPNLVLAAQAGARVFQV